MSDKLFRTDDACQLCSFDIRKAWQVTSAASPFNKVKQSTIIILDAPRYYFRVMIYANKFTALMGGSFSHKIAMVLPGPSRWACHLGRKHQSNSVGDMTNSTGNIMLHCRIKWRESFRLIFSWVHVCPRSLYPCRIFVVLRIMRKAKVIRAASSMAVPLSSSKTW